MAQPTTHRNLDVMVSAIKVQFLKPIFEDDFVERGMTAWLTGVLFFLVGLAVIGIDV